MEAQASAGGTQDVSTPIQAEATEQANPAESAPQVPNYKGTKHKLKIEDQELELDYDELLTEASKGRGADKKFQAAAQMRKQVEQFIKGIEEGTELDRLMKIMPKEKAIKWAEELLLEKLRYDELSPEQKRVLQLEQEKEEYARKAKEYEEKEKQQYKAAAQQQAIEQIDIEIGQALKSLGKPATPRLVARIAEQMLASMSSDNAQRIPANKAMQTVLGEFQQELSEYIENLSVEEARKVLPKKLIDGLRKADIEAVTSPMHKTAAKKDVSEVPKKNQRKMTTDDWFQRMDHKLQGVK